MNPGDVMLWILCGFFGLALFCAVALVVWFIVDAIRGRS